MKHRNLNVLLVEDNEGDILLTQEALTAAGIGKIVYIARDGEQAISYLDFCKTDHCRLDLVLLDINLPKVNGLQVLKYIKHDQKLRKTIVVMLSTSSSDKDISTSYNDYANCYITKPSDLDKFMITMNHIKEYWVDTAEIPLKN